MKKLAIALLAVVSVAMFIAPSFADDRVSLYGSFRVRAWDNNYLNGDETSNIDQRFRIGTRINVADDVYVEMRADYGEGSWGLNYGPGYVVRPRTGDSSELDIDRGFLNIDKEMWSLRVGQQFLALGVSEVLDANATAAKLVLKLPVQVSLIYGKASENGSLNDDGANEDTDFYAMNLSYDTDAFSSNLYAVTQDDGTATDDSRTMFGFNGNAKLGMVDLTAELDFATGDYNDAVGNNIDYMGTQFYLKGSANLTDAFSMGAELLYALGTDDANEVQLTNICDWASFVPMSSNTPFDADVTAFDSNVNWFSPFDPTGDSAGVQGITLFGAFKVMDGLSLGAKVGYFTPEEDSVTDVDDITSFNVWASYMLATNTELALAYFYSDYDEDGATPMFTEEQEIMVARLQVNF